MKKIFVILLITVSLLNGCTKNSPSVNRVTNPPPPTPTTQYRVGDIGPSAGRIVHIDSSVNPRTYYESTLDTIGIISWGCGGTYINYNPLIYVQPNGQQNTIDIVQQCASPQCAARLCSNYSITVNGIVYDDWFLPSATELGWILGAGLITHITNIYWTSNQVLGQPSLAYGFRRDRGDILGWPKSNPNLVIALRRWNQ